MFVQIVNTDVSMHANTPVGFLVTVSALTSTNTQLSAAFATRVKTTPMRMVTAPAYYPNIVLAISMGPNSLLALR